MINYKFFWHEGIKKHIVFFLMMLQFAFALPFYYLMYHYSVRLIIDNALYNQDNMSYPILLFIFSELFFSVIFRIYDFGYRGFFAPMRISLLQALFKVIITYRYSFFHQYSTGNIMGRIKGIVEDFDDMVKNFLLHIFNRGILIIFFVTYLFFIQRIIGLFLLFWTVSYIVTILFFSKKLLLRWQSASEEGYSLLGILSDQIKNIFFIRIFGGKQHALELFEEQGKKKYLPSAYRAANYFIILQCIGQIFYLILAASIIMITVNFVVKKEITPGAFSLVMGFVFHIIENIWIFVTELQHFLRRVGNLRGAMSIFHGIEREKKLPALSFSVAAIYFDDISFGYDQSNSVFKNFTLSIKAGEHIGIVGESGGGKSTLIDLLMKLYEPTEGRILINGNDIFSHSSESLYAHMSVIPQEITLFEQSIYENIVYGSSKISYDEVMEIAKISKVDSFVTLFPDGYNTIIGKDGCHLSGGEQQRIVLARAMARKAPIVIFDEATSQLDIALEIELRGAIKKYFTKHGSTVIVIAHRLSVVTELDRIIVLNRGKIVEDGSHDKLIKIKDGVYHSWYRLYIGER